VLTFLTAVAVRDQPYPVQIISVPSLQKKSNTCSNVKYKTLIPHHGSALKLAYKSLLSAETSFGHTPQNSSSHRSATGALTIRMLELFDFITCNLLTYSMVQDIT
jgi:hypothetical protein